jgi:hypothetical protein
MTTSRRTSPILDRRTIVTLLTNLGLFVLAFRNIKPEVAIDAMAFITVALIAGNASQRALIAWSGRGILKKQPKPQGDSK